MLISSLLWKQPCYELYDGIMAVCHSALNMSAQDAAQSVPHKYNRFRTCLWQQDVFCCLWGNGVLILFICVQQLHQEHFQSTMHQEHGSYLPHLKIPYWSVSLCTSDLFYILLQLSVIPTRLATAFEIELGSFKSHPIKIPLPSQWHRLPFSRWLHLILKFNFTQKCRYSTKNTF